MIPTVHCPKCNKDEAMDKVLTAHSNQNVMYRCPHCAYSKSQIQTSKG